MITTILSLIFIYILYRKSKSTYFYGKNNNLKQDQATLLNVCAGYGFSVNELTEVYKAFDYFIKNPHKFDGATIVADNYTINGLSVTAMVHDYQTIMIGKVSFFEYIQKRWQTDWYYFSLLQKVKRKWVLNTILNSIILILLTISTPIYYFIK